MEWARNQRLNNQVVVYVVDEAGLARTGPHSGSVAFRTRVAGQAVDLASRSRGASSPRAFAIFADFARTAVLAAAAERSESQLVRAKLAKHAKRREEQHNDGNGNRTDGQERGEPPLLLWLFFGA